MYYNYDKIISYNALLNFLIGTRGVGKTYGITKFVIKQFIKKGHEFFYVRRFRSELKKSVPNFFDAIIKNDEFVGHELSVKGSNFMCDGKICGYSYNLSTSQNLKSANFPKVKYIIFDEFIIENNTTHYLANEVNAFLGLIETIARDRNVNVFLLGNAVSIINPYFLYFDLELPYNSDIRTFKNGTILLQYMRNEEFINYKKQTRFGTLVENTSYSDYAIDNKFNDLTDTFIRKKEGTSKFAFTILYKNMYFGVWYDFTLGCIFVSRDYNEHGQTFVLTNSEHKENTLLITSIQDYTPIKTFVKNYKLGNVYFETQKIKNIFKEVIKLFVKK